MSKLQIIFHVVNSSCMSGVVRLLRSDPNTFKSQLPSSKLILTVDSTDDNYMPKRVTVFGGEGDSLKKLSDVTLDE